MTKGSCCRLVIATSGLNGVGAFTVSGNIIDKKKCNLDEIHFVLWFEAILIASSLIVLSKK